VYAGCRSIAGGSLVETPTISGSDLSRRIQTRRDVVEALRDPATLVYSVTVLQDSRTMTPETTPLPGRRDLDAARTRIAGLIHRTPMLSSRRLGELGGADVRLKCENLQRTGSFKIRGALNAVLAAKEREAIGPGGVLTYSSGNHGQAVAFAARIVGFTATIVVPETIPRVKEAAIIGYGARVVHAGRTSEDRRRRAVAIAAETGAHIVPPFDDPDIVCGQASVALEILEDHPDVDTIFVPIGGGGLIGGIALAVGLAGRGRKVYGVEPLSANAMQRSLEAGQLMMLTDAPRTIADGLCPVRPGELPFRIAQEHVEEVVTVDDDAIRTAQRILLERAKLFVEPSGAATVAALLRHKDRFAGRRIVAVLSGGNAELPAGIFSA
jgi:threonine dehydratase